MSCFPCTMKARCCRLEGRPATVRADRVRLGCGDAAACTVHGVVRGVEYQGSTVTLVLAVPDGEITAVIPEEHFYPAPATLGDRRAVHWARSDEDAFA